MQFQKLFIDPLLSALASAYAYYNSCLVSFPSAIDIQVCLIAHRVNILSGWQVPAVAAVSAAAALASMMCRLCLWLWGQSQAAVSL